MPNTSVCFVQTSKKYWQVWLTMALKLNSSKRLKIVWRSRQCRMPYLLSKNVQCFTDGVISLNRWKQRSLTRETRKFMTYHCLMFRVHVTTYVASVVLFNHFILALVYNYRTSPNLCTRFLLCFTDTRYRPIYLNSSGLLQWTIAPVSSSCHNLNRQSNQYREAHYKAKPVSRQSYLYNGNSHTWKYGFYIGMESTPETNVGKWTTCTLKELIT